jgi:cardiolipin synthase
VRVRASDPSKLLFPIRGMYLEAIERAQTRIWITVGYFVPDRGIRGALIDAARRGVDVRLILPERSNHPLTDALAHGMFESLLAEGIRIYLYRGEMNHAKSTTIDGSWSTVGTANLDRLSLVGNYEINIEVRDEAFAAQLEHAFLADIDCSHEVDLERWQGRGVHKRVAEHVLVTLAPLL